MTGTLPESWILPSNLDWLSLMGNKLSGTLPPNIKWPRALALLELSANQFTGTIPTKWNLMAEVALWDNLLSGEWVLQPWPAIWKPLPPYYTFAASSPWPCPNRRPFA